MTSIGISRLVVGKLLNHAEQGVTAIYDRHSYDADKREALMGWAQHLADILGDSEEGIREFAGTDAGARSERASS